jgi:DNA adenine methylase
VASALIEHLPWQDVVHRYDRAHTLFFCDPPYWRVEGYGVEFLMSEYEALANAARSIAGKMIITVNDHPDMRRVFAGLNICTAPIKYTVGTAASRSAKRTELIIRSW